MALLHLVAHLLQQVGILVGAEDGGAAGGNVHVALLGNAGHLVLHIVLADGLGHAAVRLHVKEQLPGILGDAVGEVLNIIAATGGVDNLVHVALLLQQQLLVAADAVAEAVALLEGDVEGVGGDAVGTGNGGAHGLGGGAEHVDVGVVYRFVPQRAGGIDEHLAAAVAARVVLLHHLAPQQAGGAYLGNLHEVVAASGKVEHQAGCDVVDSESEVGEVGHQVVGCSQGEAQLLHDIGARIVDVATVDGQHVKFGQVLFGVQHQLFGLGKALLLTSFEGTVEQGAAIDVVIDAAFDLGGVVAAPFHHFDEAFEGLHCVFATGEVHLAGLRMDAFEQALHVLHALAFAGAEADAVGTTFQGFQSQCVGLLQ